MQPSRIVPVEPRHGDPRDAVEGQQGLAWKGLSSRIASFLNNPIRVNLTLQAVGAFYRFLVRRGKMPESPVRYVDVSRGKGLIESDLLVHTRRGQADRIYQRTF